MKKMFLFMTLAVLAVSACNIPHKRTADIHLATEVSMASTSIRETVEAGWTETPFPSETQIPDASATPTVALFVDPENRDYHLQPDSPAFKIGFVPFDYTQAGCQENTAE